MGFYYEEVYRPIELYRSDKIIIETFQLLKLASKVIGRWSYIELSYKVETFELSKFVGCWSLRQYCNLFNTILLSVRFIKLEKCNPLYTNTFVIIPECRIWYCYDRYCVLTDCILARFQPFNRTKINHHKI